MRKLLRRMAKAEMARQGYTKINRRMKNGQWRQVLQIVPTERDTGRKFYSVFRGKKCQKKNSHQPVLTY